MQAVFKLIGQVAPSNATVLITGESGTGKELVARAIYHHSPRSSQPFMAINCAAIPEQLLESELFGHEKGAFTGALAQRIGKFEQCHRGTLFLDEIGDMSLVTQAKILRVLQSGAFERVGGNETVKADVRVLAATNQLLDKAVAGRRFREDLFYRLNVVRIHMPPLRERPGDVRYLAEYFLRNISQGQHPKSISADTLEALDQYSWPGNVRELENVIHRAIVMSKGGIITRVDLPPEIGDKPRVAAAQPDSAAARAAEAAPPGEVGRLAQQLFLWARENSTLKVLPAVERELVICALREANGNQVQAARLLGITRATLRKRMERFHVRQELKFE
jgi:two-component system nitrogen regulation response regulator GlnG